MTPADAETTREEREHWSVGFAPSKKDMRRLLRDLARAEARVMMLMKRLLDAEAAGMEWKVRAEAAEKALAELNKVTKTMAGNYASEQDGGP